MFSLNKPALAAIAGLVTLSACTQPGFDESDPNYNAKTGAVLGGLVGAAVGVARADDPEERRRNAVIGAALGAGAGTLVGTQLDRQAADLRESMANDQVDIVNTGSSLIVTLPQDILFATDSTAIRPDLRRDLMALAQNLQAYPNSAVQIIGHTDNTGSAAYNQDLSLRRAQSVANVLFSAGISTSRLVVTGRGEDQPVATNLTPEGRAQNRRVEVVIVPTT